MNPSIAHEYDMNHFGLSKYPDKKVPWDPARTPQEDLNPGPSKCGRLASCGYCGSMHPSDVVAALRAGATAHWADFKYGWPHKLYLENIPNPHAGMPEIRASSSKKSEQYPHEHREARYNERTGERMADYVSYHEEPKPAAAKTYGKFYTVHLKDCTEEERDVIEKAMGACFFFEEGSVRWKPYDQAHPNL